MLRTPKEKICECGNHFIQYNSLKKHCSVKCEIKYKPHSQKIKKTKPINKVSAKQYSLNKQYSKLRIEFLLLPENQICPITGKQTTDVHHKKGRKGFADQWAKDNNIPLIIDVRFFIALSREGHDFVENNPNWAYENEYSIRRNQNLNI